MSLPVAIQLYSLRKEFEENYVDTLKKVAELGFEGVEFAGFYNIKAEDMKKTLDECNLKVAGSHTGYELLLHKLDEVMEYNKIIGNKHIICPYCDFSDEAALDNVITNFNLIGKRLDEEGFVFSYHNHSHEFHKFDGKYILDTIFEKCDKVVPELDVYWVYRGQEEPSKYIKKYSDKMNLIHLKDGTMETGTAIGEGEVDIASVIDVLDESKIEWLVIEDETPYPDSFPSVARSIKNLKSLIENK